MPEEVRFFARSAVFALVLGVIYWFVSYETAGTVLLLAFALAGFVATALLGRDARRAAREAGSDELGRPWTWAQLSPADQDSPFPSDEGRVPGASVAPLAVASGVALAMLGLVFGPWLILMAAVPLLVGGRIWLREVTAEWHAVEGDVLRAAAARPAAPATTGSGTIAPGPLRRPSQRS